MRTTLNIDDDLIRQLKQTAQKSRASLRDVVNRALRRGLAGPTSTTPRKPYVCPTFNMGKPTLNLDKALALSAGLEDQEVLRELELRK